MLDVRYRNLPEWQKLRGTRGLVRYAADCATHARALYDAPDYNVDRRGWHPPPPDLPPGSEGISQVLVAEHRLLDSLDAIPSMANLRILFTSQRGLSDLAAAYAGNVAPKEAATFRRRERAYARLSRASRTAAGFAGTGAEATRHSADALRALGTLPAGTPDTDDAWRNLANLTRHVDNRICTGIEEGFNRRLYLVRRSLPRIDMTDGNLIHSSREVFEPLQRDRGTAMLTVARQYLRADPPRSPGVVGGAISRGKFRDAIAHRQHSGRPTI